MCSCVSGVGAMALKNEPFHEVLQDARAESALVVLVCQILYVFCMHALMREFRKTSQKETCRCEVPNEASLRAQSIASLSDFVTELWEHTKHSIHWHLLRWSGQLQSALELLEQILFFIV